MEKSAGEETLILEALERALADPTPRKLHGTKANPGVFLSSSAPAKAAAQRCLEWGLFEKSGELRTKSKSVLLYGIAPAGVRYLWEHDPIPSTLEAAHRGVESVARLTADCHATLQGLQEHVRQLGKAIHEATARVQPPDIEKIADALSKAQAAVPCGVESSRTSVGTAAGAELERDLLRYLEDRKRQSPLRPVELPQLFRFARSRCARIGLGQFHDLLRGLVDSQRVRLIPFTQAMYQLSEPECAMIVGREVMYYAERA
jgi:hypothetical protein